MNIPVYVLTNDRHLWLLRGFGYLFNKYWPGQSVTVFGFNKPSFPLPDSFRFQSMGRTNYPARQWSDAVKMMLSIIPESHFIFMLEDYWLNRIVDPMEIEEHYLLAKSIPQLLRLDLSNDRVTKKGVYKQTMAGGGSNFLNVVRSPAKTPYQMSFQAGIWNREQMNAVMRPGETPWEAEVVGSERLKSRPDLIVLGATTRPLKYSPVYRSKRYRLILDAIPEDDRNVILGSGWVMP